MRRSVAVVPVLLLVTSGLATGDADKCLSVWVDTRDQVADCAGVDVQAALANYPKTCRATSADKAVVKVRLTTCREQVAAAVAPPGSTVAGREFVVRAQATEGRAAKELSGHNGDSWAGAARDLCRAIVVWHGNLKESH